MNFLAAEEVRAALHEGNLQIGREVFLQEGNVFLEELLLQGLRRRGDNHATAAANRRDFRYASVLPVPVPASITTCWCF